ncbi:MAG: ribonuclease H family protein [Candidatus Kapabacteria bacterium]|nr:ribonuclease H family protein [Candidatus Kapabacteria bacterium]
MAAVKKSKWYVVWTGHNPGIYTSWDDAKKQIHGVPGAQYKSYESPSAAKEAFERGHVHVASQRPRATHRNCILPSLAVDAACDMTTGVMEYRGVDVGTGTEIFRMGPYLDSSNNLGEFLAVVHALAYCKQNGIALPIYSDSRTALSWVRNKLAKTTVARTYGNAEVFALIARAETWLKTNTYPNVVLKWKTKEWGENPADFGRK